MRTRLAAPSILFLALAAAACGEADQRFWPTPGAGARPKLLLVGWDGVRPDVLAQVSTPNLDTLVALGAFSPRARASLPTVSGPCWSSMLTGVEPAKHGVLNNDFSSNRYREYPDFLTRIEQTNPERSTFAAADWLPLVAADAGGPLISDLVDRKLIRDGYQMGWLEADSASVDAAIEELRIGDPDALFVYLGAPDEISHITGGIGEEYRSSIATADRHLGRLLDAIRARPRFRHEDWLVLVSTDHGRTLEGGHGGDSPEETTVFFLVSGPSVVAGEIAEPPALVDVAVTALAHLGIAADPAWGLDGKVVGLRR
jgi:predicted AlkP superfamily pyrophosphatase or phosphodiesterase